MITATIDVNCVNLKEHPSLDLIWKLHREKKIELFKTDTLDLEIIYGNPNAKNNERIAKSSELKEDKGAFTLGHSRLSHALVGSDKTLHRLKKSSELTEDNGVGLWGHFRWGHGKWGSKEDSYVDEFKKILFKDFDQMREDNQRRSLRDCIHLSTHLVYGRNFFITENNDFLRHKDLLKSSYDINVIHFDDFVNLEEIKKISVSKDY
ncbi:MAG: hypothetical protein KAU20_07720 [Nanoarchaeota archaeon]|nr:hypothetical protein [Nanoarchaeota archaeon]